MAGNRSSNNAKIRPEHIRALADIIRQQQPVQPVDRLAIEQRNGPMGQPDQHPDLDGRDAGGLVAEQLMMAPYDRQIDAMRGQQPSKWANILGGLGATLQDAGAGFSGRGSDGAVDAWMANKQTQQQTMQDLMQNRIGAGQFGKAIGSYDGQPMQEWMADPNNAVAIASNPELINVLSSMRAPPPPDPIPLAYGAQLRGPGGALIAENERREPPAYEGTLAYQHASAGGIFPPGSPEFDERYYAGKRSGATNVDVGDSGPQFGTVPPGYMMSQNEDGSWEQNPVTGSPPAQEIDDAAAQAIGRREAAQRYGDIVIEDTGRIIDLVESSEWPTTGFVGSLMSAAHGTAAHQVKLFIDGLEGAIAFDRIRVMRENSPSGGALGNVSERELDLLAAAYGSLKQSGRKEDFLFNMKRLERIYLETIHGKDAAGQIIAGFESNAGLGIGAGGDSAGVPIGVDPEDWAEMTPEQRALWP